MEDSLCRRDGPIHWPWVFLSPALCPSPEVRAGCDCFLWLIERHLISIHLGLKELVVSNKRCF